MYLKQVKRYQLKYADADADMEPTKHLSQSSQSLNVLK